MHRCNSACITHIGWRNVGAQMEQRRPPGKVLGAAVASGGGRLAPSPACGNRAGSKPGALYSTSAAIASYSVDRRSPYKPPRQPGSALPSPCGLPATVSRSKCSWHALITLGSPRGPRSPRQAHAACCGSPAAPCLGPSSARPSPCRPQIITCKLTALQGDLPPGSRRFRSRGQRPPCGVTSLSRCCAWRSAARGCAPLARPPITSRRPWQVGSGGPGGGRLTSTPPPALGLPGVLPSQIAC